jgi:serine/threonine protein kinase
MRLWNDYEGTTIADVYPIEKLIRPEGRSAFFSTSNGTGTPAVIRLIESINDEGEILKRWKTVADLKETHLVTLKKFGQTVFEGTPLIYVLMESTEIDLGSILQQGTLSVEETRQLATSLVEAVSALHASGIVHEHIEPANVLATGEIVKLRSDCVRETPEGDEGPAAIKRDVHDIAVVLLQALTQRKNLETIGTARLPAPFDEMIRNGISGKWGLTQMAAALNPPQAKVVAAAAPKVPTPKPGTIGTPAPNPKAQQMPLKLPDTTPPLQPRHMSPALPRERPEISIKGEESSPRRKWWIAVAPAAAILIAALGWSSFHKPASRPAQPITTLQNTTPAPTQNSKPGSASHAVPVQQPIPAAAATARWRLIAYTYNHQDQAQHKVDELMQKDASLRPEVFSPNNGVSYLVALGGMMTREQAVAFRQKAASEGLPRDIYIQNYGGHRTRRSGRR